MASTDTNQPKTAIALARDKKRKEIMADLKTKFDQSDQYRMTATEQRNIMLIGRSRTGKSTIKSLLVNPLVVPDQLTLKSGTRDPDFKSFFIEKNKSVLNIIDTPGLFERSDVEIDIRDNAAIMKTIEMCVNREITKFHVVCFCVALTEGINQQDIQSLVLLAEFLGSDVQSNSCLIVTRCESKDEEVLAQLDEELRKDSFFQKIAPYFKLGIFFSGSLDPDAYNKAMRDSLEDQFDTICKFRATLINLFTSDIKPYPINELMISEVRRSREKEEHVLVELQRTKSALDQSTKKMEKQKSRSPCNTQ